MGELDHPFDEIRVYTPTQLDAEIFLPPLAKSVVLRSTLPPSMWEQITLRRAHGNAGLLLCPSYVIPLFAGSPTFLIHHGSYEGYPQAFSWWTLSKARAIYSASAKRATGVSTVSEFSRRDMARFYGMDASRIHVVPEGVDTRHFRPLADPTGAARWRSDTFGSDLPFVLYVGKPTERRNLSSLMRAFARLKRESNIPHKLVIAGADLPGTSPFRTVIAEEGLTADVVVRGYVSHDELVTIYNAADLMVYPSSYEGFGMPVLEAMACGTPVIALKNTAFPEFAGGVARLLSDASVETLRSGIEAVLSDAALRQKMASDGPKRAAAYDWRIVTRRYLDLMIPLAV